ncbi:UDP-2,3-diacylglucosamine diphosphatase [Zeaxanthinibacter enoshimensis]|uniref:UDP-2,3-diacylglucosamine hydrolase n=1 Tax=Zeaxanthinibacter enoshimensis TaxID=392009 RepID=A0A4R6TRX6_9FLAO|nr:UDP-2,3-diacylglucosamine diphosphatase [Zeaxanthinibacter enoshimensis]TDQ32903.1 UDP-2,3-diacylglucosamine hydrolase [Zeaxanthinibacter enoshimensis]
MKDLQIPNGKKVYFASDHHLGAPDHKTSLSREKKFVAWLDSIKEETAALFLLGDLFDFWFEYKSVVPKGFTRTLGKLAEFSDAGIPVFYFVGNHDLWMHGYFEEELQIPVFHTPQQFRLGNSSFFIGHGDGLGPGDLGFKRMKKVFTNPVAKWFYRWLHPDLGVRVAQYFSVKNKLISGDEDIKFLGEDKEWLVQYAKRKLEEQHYDFFVFGHRHLPLQIDLNGKSTYVNLGDWISYFTYAVYDGKELLLKKYEDSQP